MEKIFSSNFIGTHGREVWRFFYEATLRSYGNVNLNKEGPNDETSCETNANDDGSNTIVFEKGDWSYSDKYFRDDSFSGMVTISYRSTACFAMVYWGKVLPHADKTAVYSCLQSALGAIERNHPWRGPDHFVANNELCYTNLWCGKLEKFHGQEKIDDTDGCRLYEGNYFGGTILR